MERSIKICEKLGWSITDNEDGTVTVSQFSPAGEDFFFDVSKDNFAKNVMRYAADFDEDEHIEMHIEARRAGVSGIPCSRELVKDAEAIKAMLVDLADALIPRATIREQVAACSDAFVLVKCCGLLGFFSNTRVSEVNLPDGLFAYEFRGDGEDLDFCTLEKSVQVNYSGTFITDVDIELGPDGYITLSEDDQPNFVFEHEIDGCEGLAEWFANNPNNNRWETPLSFEITGLSTAQALMVKDAISEAIESVLNNNSTYIRSVMPQDNLGIVRWSTEDIQRKFLDNNQTALKRDELLRAARYVDRYTSDLVTESGWCVVDTAIDEALDEKSAFPFDE